jgi:hypothetical protein
MVIRKKSILYLTANRHKGNSSKDISEHGALIHYVQVFCKGQGRSQEHQLVAIFFETKIAVATGSLISFTISCLSVTYLH